MFNTPVSVAQEGEGAAGEEAEQRLMAKEPSVMANAVWQDAQFWQVAMWQMITTERDKMREMMGPQKDWARPSLIPALRMHFARAGIEWRR